MACDIDNITDTSIMCITQKAPVAKDTYPGSRGILWEKWADTNRYLLKDICVYSYRFIKYQIFVIIVYTHFSRQNVRAQSCTKILQLANQGLKSFGAMSNVTLFSFPIIVSLGIETW